jgi:hypothetical protein
MGCSYPARPAFAKVDTASETPVEWSEDRPSPALRRPPPAPARPAEAVRNQANRQILFVSKEVVQNVEDAR